MLGVQAAFRVGFGRIGDQLAQRQLASADHVVARYLTSQHVASVGATRYPLVTHLVPIEHSERKGESALVAPDVEQQFLVPCRIERMPDHSGSEHFFAE
jgi:hypothetical protein